MNTDGRLGGQTSHRNKVIVMARSQRHMKAIRNRVTPKLPRKNSGVVFYTYHGAKGLQGEVAVMVGDCSYTSTNRFRNLIYAKSDLAPPNYSYDDAMLDEAYRLGYVGVTRGKRRTVWFAYEPKGAFEKIG